MSSAFIMSEVPAPCCFKCKYCYVPPKFDRRKDKKQVTGRDFLNLAERTGADKFLFWMCAIGEPFMRPDYREVLDTLRALRDLRRYMPTVNIRQAGQVNIGEQQVNAVVSGKTKPD